MPASSGADFSCSCCSCAGTTASAVFGDSATSGWGVVGLGTASGTTTGTDAVGVSDGGGGVILRRFGALSPSATVSSSLSRLLSSRGLSIGGEDVVVIVGSGGVGAAARISPSTAEVVVAGVGAGAGAVVVGEDSNGEEVNGSGGGSGVGGVVRFLTAAAPHVHFSRNSVSCTAQDGRK